MPTKKTKLRRRAKRNKGFDRLIDKHINPLLPCQENVKIWMLHILADISMSVPIRYTVNRVTTNFKGSLEDRALVLDMIADIKQNGV